MRLCFPHTHGRAEVQKDGKSLSPGMNAVIPPYLADQAGLHHLIWWLECLNMSSPSGRLFNLKSLIIFSFVFSMSWPTVFLQGYVNIRVTLNSAMLWACLLIHHSVQPSWEGPSHCWRYVRRLQHRRSPEAGGSLQGPAIGFEMLHYVAPGLASAVQTFPSAGLCQSPESAALEVYQQAHYPDTATGTRLADDIATSQVASCTAWHNA